MPRGSFRHEDAGQAGFGFQEGYVQIMRSVIRAHQLPPNSKTGEQSDAFCAMYWTMKKLDNEWNELAGEESDTTITHAIRLGPLDQMRPGKLDPKDFDNLDAEPKDLGEEVGTEGNALYLEEGAKPSRGWGILEESLRKCGFKAEVSGRGVATDYEGMVAHFKTVEGTKYIAKQGKNKGQEVTPTNLVCDRIHTFPWDVKKSGGSKGSSKDAKSSTTKDASKDAKSAGSTSSSSNGTVSDEAMAAAVALFGSLSAEFKKDVPDGKEVARADFQKQTAKELMRQKVKPNLQKGVLDIVKDDEKLIELATELGGAFVVGDGTVTFG